MLFICKQVYQICLFPNNELYCFYTFSLSPMTEISIVLAQFWGGFFIIFGLLFIITGYLGKLIEMTDDKAFVISTGYITLLMGLMTVVLHNVWVKEWVVVITVLGWVTLLKGMTKIAFPEFIHKQAQRFKSNQLLSGAFMIGFGGYMLYMVCNA